MGARPPGRERDWRDRFFVPRRVDAQEPLAAALWDHFESGRSRTFKALRSEGFAYGIDTSLFFGLEGDTAFLDERALDAARGRVLDVGSGAGRHALALQARGQDVCAIDVSPTCVELMRRRGVADPRCIDVFHLEAGDAGGFDTVLLLMQSIGIAGTRLGFESLLGKVRACLRPGGQVLLDSSALQGELGVAVEGDAARGRGPGEVEVRFHYRNLRGRAFPWLYLSEEQLAEWAAAVGWRCEILQRADDTPEYLARLVPSDDERDRERDDD